MMRRWLTLTVIASVLGCTRPAAEVSDHTTQPLDLTHALAIRLEHGLGGWGNGSEYSFEVDRSGRAVYVGKDYALFKGRYNAQMTPALVTSLFDQATKQGYLQRQADHCYDAPTRTITLILPGNKQIRFGAGCAAPDSNNSFASQLESIFSQLDWASDKRAT
jgi:hypothetical protein